VHPTQNTQQSPNVNPFMAQKQTPSTHDSGKQSQGTPNKFKSPGSLVKDLTKAMEDASMHTPPKNELD